ncbi:MAG: hypothetical protein A2268_09935 [Candidatus Raymondbacteria bacterium RifOxyA12_full_50_37]|uniref:Response regulatory domain-containing protein n=1 Tax=Candidatus Raymondbacteria bacterium RIFOXYD12_FULL_49_13 TaxID=1817890 RepID=A0A1F7F495_UNCRA|nr:MAG: hypothetical protein A2268_09935 [Candidatus Raymondbacteria bacterium RifOxyA12_full_50_37]OGJ93843.1 MAG: hypothetical protein A2248_06365 [Candidatus Raymondbacteria bacterium RIFOXYA2_FULL_49_16]OGJ97321.1 MAG: hypothetical protein A2487_16465 [Candidatus Raymondbacteria bacterium RifOxyC12_full_50_8]OGJ98290.1 MAG: hypothetical protein A2453_00810 [Candidatus Raymondbacteria bacterium RIFOXYC2_FULL_50_21]OGK01408.1 MAG: hypothetical protein A2519_14970 [Candidatus Raymondbacteria b
MVHLTNSHPRRTRKKKDQRVVLVIEDDASASEMLTHFLERKNCRVATSENGLIGLTMIKFLKPDVIITDLMIPGLDGRVLVERIRENIYMKGKMVVVVSGMFTERYNGERIHDIDADAVFSKPVNLARLHAAIERYYAKG